MPDKDKKRVKVRVVEESTLKEPTKEHHDEHEEREEHDEHEEEKHQESHESYEDQNHDHEHEHEDEEKKEEKNDATEETSPYPKQDKIPTWVLIFSFLTGLTLGAGLIGGIFYYRSKVGKLAINVPQNNSFESAETPAPSPTPQAEKLDLTKYSVNILNGSGISGEAGRVETLLKTAGFTNTKTGNAGSYDFTDTEVAIKKGLPESLYDEVKKDLEKYVIKRIDDLAESSSYDIVITVGKSKN